MNKRNDKYYMQFAELIRGNSADPKTKVGAVAVDKEGEIVGTGFNHFPGEETFDWLDKYPYVVHAEIDALMDIGELKDGTLYVTLFPCNKCAQIIADRGIKTVVYIDDKYINEEYSKTAINIFNKCGIEFKKISL